MKSEIVIKQERRPCFFALPGKAPERCLFHQWCNEVVHTREGNEKHEICALLETDRGHVLTVPAQFVRFIDHSEFTVYAWPWPTEEGNE